MNVLVIDVGGTHVKILATGQDTHREFASGSKLTPERMVAGVQQMATDWKYDVVSIGYPGPVLGGRPVSEPQNLGKGWVGFDFQAAFGCPVKVINDAAMQALGSYQGGKMLFLGQEPVWVQLWSWKASWSPWRWGTFRTRMGPTRTTWGSVACSGWERSDGRVTSLTWWLASSLPWSRTTW